MNKQELIKHFEDLPYVSVSQMGKKAFIDMIEQLDEPQPIKLKDVIARIKKLDLDSQEVWLNKILNELGSDCGSLKYRAGYEQGKFEGEYVGQQLKDADKVRQELNKPVVKQFVADWYEEHKDDFDYNLWEYLTDWEEQEPSEFKEWFNKSNKAFQTLVNMHQFGYEVEKEKRYYVRLKGVVDNLRLLRHNSPTNTWTIGSEEQCFNVSRAHTRKELEEAGFGWVFDCPGVEIEVLE
jgi:hypothetical protein